MPDVFKSSVMPRRCWDLSKWLYQDLTLSWDQFQVLYGPGFWSWLRFLFRDKHATSKEQLYLLHADFSEMRRCHKWEDQVYCFCGKCKEEVCNVCSAFHIQPS